MIRLQIKTDKRGWAYFKGPKGRVRIGGAAASAPYWLMNDGQLASDHSALGLSTALWCRLGDFAIKTIRERVARGLGSSDQPMPPLTKRYAIQKSKLRLGNKRNLMGTGEQGGHMLDALRVTYVDQRSCKIDITTRDARMKARANEQRSPWIGFSPSDRAKILSEFKRLFGTVAIDAGKFLASFRGLGGAKWMDPLGLRNSGRRAA
jgi:hypothetical protein